MRQFTTVDLLRDFKAVSHAAARSPVTITQHRKAAFVLMAVEDFDALQMRAKDPREVHRTDDTPDDLRALLEPALEAYLARSAPDRD